VLSILMVMMMSLTAASALLDEVVGLL